MKTHLIFDTSVKNLFYYWFVSYSQLLSWTEIQILLPIKIVLFAMRPYWTATFIILRLSSREWVFLNISVTDVFSKETAHRAVSHVLLRHMLLSWLPEFDMTLYIC